MSKEEKLEFTQMVRDSIRVDLKDEHNYFDLKFKEESEKNDGRFKIESEKTDYRFKLESEKNDERFRIESERSDDRLIEFSRNMVEAVDLRVKNAIKENNEFILSGMQNLLVDFREAIKDDNRSTKRKVDEMASVSEKVSWLEGMVNNTIMPKINWLYSKVS